MTFIVDYTTEDCGHLLQMEIDAPDLESAYEKVNAEYPEFSIDRIYPELS